MDPEMSMEQIWEKIRGKKNVIGYSKKLRKRVRDGREVEEEVIRIYVSKKVDPSALDLKDLIPKEIDGISTDVVEIGEMKALGLHPLAHVTRIRPLVTGVSVVSWAISIGTPEWFFRDASGREMLGSNAHVFADNALRSSSEETRIMQPGWVD